jgi:hypothetical protein
VASRADALAHVDELTALFAFGAACFALLWCFQNAWIRGSLAVGVVVAAYLGTGNLFKEYNPLCENSHFFPVTPSIEVLQRKVGHDRLVILGEDTLPPDTNMAYGLRLISSYDGLWIRRYDRLFRAMFGESNNWRNTLHGTARGLRLFGVDWVLSKDEWIPIGTLFPDVPMERRRMGPIGELVPGAPVAQSFTPTLPRMQAIRLLATTHGRRLDGLALWTLEDAATGEQLLNGTVECRDYWTVADEPLSVILRFDEPLNVAGRAMTLRLEAPDAQPGRALSLFARRDADGYVKPGPVARHELACPDAGALDRQHGAAPRPRELAAGPRRRAARGATVPGRVLRAQRLRAGGEPSALRPVPLQTRLDTLAHGHSRGGGGIRGARLRAHGRADAGRGHDRGARGGGSRGGEGRGGAARGKCPGERPRGFGHPEALRGDSTVTWLARADHAVVSRLESARQRPGSAGSTRQLCVRGGADRRRDEHHRLRVRARQPAHRGWISLACLGAGVLLVGGLVLIRRRGLAAMARSPGSG